MSTIAATNLKNADSASNNVVLNVDGTTTIAAPSNIIKSGTSVATTSGTAIDFTGIPSWVKRVTVMFSGVSLSGSAHFLIQLGSGSFATTGYAASGNYLSGGVGSNGISTSVGFPLFNGNTANTQSGHVILTLQTSNTWVASGVTSFDNTITNGFTGGKVTLSGVLDRVRLTNSGTDTFDAGSVNILFEG